MDAKDLVGLLGGKVVFTIALLIITGSDLGASMVEAFKGLLLSSLHPWLFMRRDLRIPRTSTVLGTQQV